MSDPFVAWTPADVGCHWSRALPDGRTVHMSSWSCGSRPGYVLTLDFERRVLPDLAAATAAYALLAAVPNLAIADVPGVQQEPQM